MRISGNDMRYNIGSIYTKKAFYNPHPTEDDHNNDKPSDSASFSEKGKQFSAIMTRLQSLDPELVDASVTAIKSALQSLDLLHLSLATLSRHDLERVYDEVNTTLDQFSEDASIEDTNIDIKNLDDDSLSDLVHSMKSHSEVLISSLNNLQGMGSLALSNAYSNSPSLKNQRLTNYNAQMAMSRSTTDREDIELIQSLVDALEADDLEHGSKFFSTVSHYLSNSDLATRDQLLASH